MDHNAAVMGGGHSVDLMLFLGASSRVHMGLLKLLRSNLCKHSEYFLVGVKPGSKGRRRIGEIQGNLELGARLSSRIRASGQGMAGGKDSSFLHGDVFWLDGFALRQWDDPDYQGTRIEYDKASFLEKIHEAHHKGAKWHDGYAPFCKHIFVENFVGARVGNVEITDDNRHLLVSGYVKRRPEELAVLSRWFPKNKVIPPVASFLDIILYSRDQLVQEYAALEGASSQVDLPDVPWGIISAKAQHEDFETPMNPITMMRNALGVAEGGSGVPIDRSKYQESVKYWENHASLV